MAALDGTSRRDLERRTEAGWAALEATWGSPPMTAGDALAAAADTISNVLTAVYGPAGVHLYSTAGWSERPERLERKWNGKQIGWAEALLERAMRSWRGDSEDYFAPRNAPRREEVSGGV